MQWTDLDLYQWQYPKCAGRQIKGEGGAIRSKGQATRIQRGGLRDISDLRDRRPI